MVLRKSCQRTKVLPQFCRVISSKLQSDLWKTDPEWFRPWFNTEAYHLLYGHRSEQEASDLIQKLSTVDVLQVPGRLLEAGCGAGRHARAFSQAGWEVEAFDLSEASIHAAQRHGENPNLSYRVLDLRKLIEVGEWAGQFDLVTNFFTSLGYFSEVADQQNVVAGFAKSLRHGGWMLLDYLNLDHVRAHLIESETVRKGDVEFDIHRRIKMGWIEKSIRFEWDGEMHHHVERVQALHRNDFIELLSKHHLKVKFAWGNYELDPWSDSSPRCMLLAQKSLPTIP
jgi:2-polyprenyl-3-methyl-5-hydroxy-6-metoxy-1,4-benzoquinol methylase